MMEWSRLEENKNIEENIIKDVRNIFRLKKRKKEKKAIKFRIFRDIRNLFHLEEKDYYKTVRENNFWSNNYIECKSKGDRKTLSDEKFIKLDHT